MGLNLLSYASVPIRYRPLLSVSYSVLCNICYNYFLLSKCRGVGYFVVVVCRAVQFVLLSYVLSTLVSENGNFVARKTETLSPKLQSPKTAIKLSETETKTPFLSTQSPFLQQSRRFWQQSRRFRQQVWTGLRGRGLPLELTGLLLYFCVDSVFCSFIY